MKVADVIQTMQAQITFGRTPWGRRLNNLAVNAVSSCVSDENNQDAEAIQCLNCGIIISELLIPDGCIYCRCPDMTVDINLNKEN